MKRTVLILLLCAGGLAACSDGQDATATATDTTVFATWEELSRAQDFEAARAELERLRAEQGNSPDLALRVGVTLENLDDLAKAVRTYKDALEAFPESPKLWVALGNDYQALSRWQKARDAFSKARELGAADSFTAQPLGVCNAQLGDNETAEAEFHRALAAGVDPVSINYSLAVLRMAEKDYREAQRLLEAVLRAEPENWQALRELGFVLIATTDDPHVVADVQRLAWDVVDHQPEDWRAHMLLGDAFMAADDYEAAVEAFTRALEYSQNLPEVEQRYIEAERARRAVAEQGAAGDGHEHSETFSEDASGDPEKNSR